MTNEIQEIFIQAEQNLRIIIRSPNWLGDAVMATPIFEDVRTKWPQAHITVLCHEPIAALLKSNPFIDEFAIFSRKNDCKKKEEKRIIAELKEHAYDIAILLTGSFSSAWMFWRGHIPLRIGYSTHFRRFLLTHPIQVPKNYEKTHLVYTYKALLEPLGISKSQTVPTLFLLDQEKENAKKLLEDHGIFPEHTLIGINPGAAFGSAKCWPADKFLSLTEKLLEDLKIRIIYFGDATSKPIVDEICAKLPQRAINLAGKTNLRELIALIDQCDCFITNDSGPMHVAAALKIPLVAIFGSTNEIKTGPYGSGSVIHKHVPCSPCYLRVCPIDFRCMNSIEVSEVFEQVIKQI